METVYVLEWRPPGGHPPVYWSLHHGWTLDLSKAWSLSSLEYEALLDDDAELIAKLPKWKERKDYARWVSVLVTWEHQIGV